MSRHFSPWLHPGQLPVMDATSDENECSEVRARPTPSRSLVPRPVATAHPVERSERVDQKIREAEALIEGMPATDDRVRLMRMAIVRRDEALIDGVLAALRRHQPETPPRRRYPSSHFPKPTKPRLP